MSRKRQHSPQFLNKDSFKGEEKNSVKKIYLLERVGHFSGLMVNDSALGILV